MKKFLELQYLVDDLVDFFKLTMFINASLPLNILFDDVDRRLGQQKKHFVRYHFYCFFLKKTVMNDLNQVVVRLSTVLHNKYCAVE